MTCIIFENEFPKQSAESNCRLPCVRCQNALLKSRHRTTFGSLEIGMFVSKNSKGWRKLLANDIPNRCVVIMTCQHATQPPFDRHSTARIGGGCASLISTTVFFAFKNKPTRSKHNTNESINELPQFLM